MTFQKPGYLFIFLLIIVLFSCEKDVTNIKLPEFIQKLVISSFISPSDTVSYINISSNRRIYGELGVDEQVGKLTAFLSDNTREVSLDTSKSGFVFRPKDMLIEEGKEFKLRVLGDKGFSVFASCIIPEKMDFFLEADTFSIPVDYYWSSDRRRIDVRLTIHDIQGKDNYYRILGKGVGYYSDPYTHESHKGDNIIRFENEFFSDKGVDGKEIIQESNHGLNYFFDHDSAFLVFYLYNTDKSYYQYHKSLNEYNGGDNPFEEVSPIFSNVTGGLGVFAAYTVDSLVLRLK